MWVTDAEKTVPVHSVSTVLALFRIFSRNKFFYIYEYGTKPNMAIPHIPHRVSNREVKMNSEHLLHPHIFVFIFYLYK